MCPCLVIWRCNSVCFTISLNNVLCQKYWNFESFFVKGFSTWVRFSCWLYYSLLFLSFWHTIISLLFYLLQLLSSLSPPVSLPSLSSSPTSFLSLSVSSHFSPFSFSSLFFYYFQDLKYFIDFLWFNHSYHKVFSIVLVFNHNGTNIIVLAVFFFIYHTIEQRI